MHINYIQDTMHIKYTTIWAGHVAYMGRGEVHTVFGIY
jgi:hypothetical protein